MKYSKAQLNAISRSICERREKERKEYIFQNDLLEEYMSSKYKKTWTFLLYGKHIRVCNGMGVNVL